MGLFSRRKVAVPVQALPVPAGRLAGKVCVVTGAAAGIGRGIAEMFAEEGGEVVVTDIDVDAATVVAGQLRERGLLAEALALDAGDEVSWRAMLERVTGTRGRLDVLVNNAASGWGAELQETTLDDWRRINRVTNDGVFVGTKLAVELMGARGSIINIASIAAIRGSTSAIAYAAAKGAVIVFSRSVAMHCAKQGNQVRVNVIAPGLIQTDGLDQLVRKFTRGNSLLKPVVHDQMIKSVPLGYLGEPRDVAHLATFLASDCARYITGQTISVDGGFTAS